VTTQLKDWNVKAAKPGDVLTDSLLGRGSGKLILRVRAKKEWYFRYRLGGRSVLCKLGEYPKMGLAEARQRAADLGRLVRAGIDPKAKDRADDQEAERDARRGSLGQLLGAYVASLRAQGKVSARGVECLFNRGVVGPFPDLAARKAADIRPEDIQLILARLLGRGLTRDVNVLRACLRAAFSFGGQQDFDPGVLVRDGVVFNLLSNPVILVPRKPEFDRARDRTLTDAELRHLWQALDGRAPPARNAVRLALVLGGQRTTQLLRARWLDFDEAAKTLTLRDAKGRGPVRDHLLPVSEWTAEMLGELRSIHAGTTGHVFEGSQGGVLRLNCVSGLVGDIAAGKGYQLRDLRRTAETRLAALRVSKETRAQLLSHGRTTGVQSRHYDRYLYLDEKREALAIWEAHLRAVLAGQAVDKVVALR
jgi:integrase